MTTEQQGNGQQTNSATSSTETPAEGLFSTKPAETTETTTEETSAETTLETKGEEEAAPEAVTLDDLTLPEEFNKDDPLAGKFLDVVNNAKLSSKERADALIGLYKEAADSFNAAAEKMWLETNEGWQKTLIEQHGERQLNERLALVSKSIEAYDRDMRERNPSATEEFGDEVRAAADLTGAGNNPSLVNYLIWLSEQHGEGAPLSGTPAGGEQSRAEKLFGST
jgi:hypothetical protein